MKSAWKSALMKLITNSLGSLEQDEVDAWLQGQVDIAPLLEPPLRNVAAYRDTVLRELYQISPSEIIDVWRSEHPEILFPEGNVVIVRVGQELLGIRNIVSSFGQPVPGQRKA